MTCDETSPAPVEPSRRRRFLAQGGVLASAGWWPVSSRSAPEARGENPFPSGFLWGAATAGHQVEGNNVSSDAWLMENLHPTPFIEPSGDACDHYHRFTEDITLLKHLGFDTFRFSLEWARIEPEPGLWSMAELDHYRRVLETCHTQGIQTMVTFNHFTVPSWFAGRGGWEHRDAPALFGHFCSTAARALGDGMTLATTLNEPNLVQLLFGIPGLKESMLDEELDQAILKIAGQRTGTDRFSSWIFGNLEHIHNGLLEGHRAGYQAIKAERPTLPVGVSLAISDDQAVTPAAIPMRDRKRRLAYEPWFELANNGAGDFLGIQTYSRSRIGPEGMLPPEKGVPLTDMGYEFWPEALEATLRYAHQHSPLPLYVTENGISATDDTQRVEYIRRALTGVAHCLRDGIDVRGYIHWSLLDNFEWLLGYNQRFGLVAVDRKTFKRTVKPSAEFLGKIAKAGGIGPEPSQG